MYIKRNIGWGLILRYAWKNLIIFTVYASIIFCLYYYLGWDFIDIPFQPLSVIGIAVAFYIGFKNSQSYDRFWEGRKIWGGIVNYSRTWTIQLLSFIDTGDQSKNKEIQQRLVYRHPGWINALRVQLRQPKSWALKENYAVETLFNKHNERNISCNETVGFVSVSEYEDLEKRVNPATHLIKNQALDITALKKEGLLDGFQEDQLQSVLEEFYNLQGMCERIKNTPFPRQYGYFSKVFTWIFVLLLPFGLLDVFENDALNLTNELKEWYAFLMIPFSVLISWIFVTMEVIGDNSEDPFEGRINDVPMTALCRTIEIDLRDMLDEKDLPKNIQPKNNILY
ncbi:bestrophin family ion channel [Lacinutrix neustonica]|uniref:Bestrophin family ion channel n=1 Tax=Lacinutrix neustonica TaxID=2980107 RepID=A0A9E8MYW5_9FLAO|nr:bestrophin family ion channel [Lacinutrix neustonica]WAC03430.1 bestrophin family ion channel [Lacinutrix neustonica]